MSRSATVAAAYLMANRGLSVDEAVEAVKAKRSCTLPSESFLSQLDVFQKGGYKVSAKDRSTRAFFRKRIVENMMNGNGSPPETTCFASVSLSSPTGLERRRLRCSSCRKVLALREHVLHPSTVPSEPSTSDNPSSFSLNDITNEDGAALHPSVVNGHGNVHGRGGAIIVNSACSGYFLEPMDWMKPIFESGQLGGKIICPNERCGSKIGNFDWAGQCCGCKDWVIPGFCLTRSKVDEIAF
ncbi:dual specificity protein phosphatase 12 [Phaffia rhodozyma]|uniref:protein-tyrosine-phosphatase n=1 Tax=Phaffia rhodozyma TaxID=264483 RepID=A0A0F7SHS6_PHARH|nr:dual specificity protein phosphatase 12 [Phaffia rhodozyma]